MRVRSVRSYAFLLFALVALVFSSTRVLAQADLKGYVALIRTNYHQETRDTFTSLARHFADQGEKELADFFDAYANAGGFGTGWIYVADDGENFIVTNRHVVLEAATVDISFEQSDGSYRTFSNAPIVYVDDFMDLALVQFPGAARVFSRGFPINASFMPDGTQLFSAGFPAFGGEPLWQFSNGIVTNSRARPVGFTGYDYLIQHSAQIDKGNSGGPLMVRDSRSPTGYAVIGVNTWKATQRENTNFSIPADQLPKVIARARAAIATRASAASMASTLDQSCRVLGAELRSPNPDLERIHQFISYALVGRRGWEAFQTILTSVDDQKSWEDSFFNDPIETMRTSLYYLFWLTLGKREGGTSIDYLGASPADRDKIRAGTDVRTEYGVGSTSTEISWTWEYGSWRVLDFELPSLGEPAAPGESTAASSPRSGQTAGLRPFSLLFIGLGFDAGDSNGHGTVYSQSWFPGSSGDSADKGIFSWTAGASVEGNLTSWLWLEAQLNLVQKGRYYQSNYPPDSDPTNDWWVSENILYLQLPVMAKIRVLLDQGLSFTIAAGPALNVAVSAGGTYWDWYDVEHALPSDWYNGFLNRVAVSAIAEVGFHFGLGGSTLGLIARVDYDLTGNFTYVIPDTSRFLTFSGGLRWAFPVYTSTGDGKQ